MERDQCVAQEVKRSARAVPSPTAVELRIRTRAEEESADVNNIISDLQHRRHPGLFQVSMAAPRALHLQQLNIMAIGINSADIYSEARVGEGGERIPHMSPLYQMSHSAQNLNQNVRQNNWVRSEREESKAAGIFLSSAPLSSRVQRADGAHYFFPAAFCSLFLFPPLTLVASTGVGVRGGEA